MLANAPRRWDFLAGLMNSLGLRSFVEIGCKEGRTTGFILKNVPDSTVIAIDPWAPIANTAEDYAKWDYAKIEAEFWQNVGEHESRCEMLRKTSVEAAAMVPVGQDLVFVDAGHDYKSVTEDIHVWWPLVRIGGILAFHDFNHKWPGVERAISDHFDLMHVGVGPDSVAFIVKNMEGQLRA